MSFIKPDTPFETKRFILSLTIPLIFIVLFWVVKALELFYDVSFYQWGIFPRSLEGIKGIFFTPFIHGDLGHIAGNSASFLILSVSLFFFYPQVALKVLWQLYLISHVLLWIGGREAWHIGASVLVYGFAAFLFVSGILKRYIPLMAISMLVVFWYGSMIWHLFPVQINDPISWEGHLFGAITGAFLAFIYRKQGPTRPPYSWELENEDNDDSDDDATYYMTEEQLVEYEREKAFRSNQSHTHHSGFVSEDEEK